LEPDVVNGPSRPSETAPARAEPSAIDFALKGMLYGALWGIVVGGGRLLLRGGLDRLPVLAAIWIVGFGFAGFMFYWTRTWERRDGPGRTVRFVVSGAFGGTFVGLMMVGVGGDGAWMLVGWPAIGALGGAGFRKWSARHDTR